MVNPRIKAIIDAIMEREGGYVHDPADLGGITNWGITEKVARAYGYRGHMRDLPRSLAFDIYYKRYVLEPNFDKVVALSPQIGEELIDAYVNMGAGDAKTKDGPAFWLQRLLNALNNEGRLYDEIVVDGIIGNQTLRALSAYLQRRGAEGHAVLTLALNGLQIARYLLITEMRPANEKFLYGWLRRQV